MSLLEIIAEKESLLIEKEALINQQEQKLQKQSEQLEQQKFKYAQLLKLIYGSSTERFIPTTQDTDQLNLFGEDKQEDQQADKEEITYKRNRYNGKHPGRQPLPENIPVIERIIEPEENIEGLDKIGEEITESIDYTPASLIKIRTIRRKYINRKTEEIYIADLPNRFINKCIADPGLLSHVAVSKYVDHVPLYRQGKQFAREFDWHVSKSTFNNWMKNMCYRMEPIYECMQEKVLSSQYIQADESPIKVLERKMSNAKKIKGKSPPDSKKRMIGYQWVYMSPEQKIVFFNYRKGRGVHGPKEILNGYQGYVQCDGYRVYDKIASQQPDIILMGCLAHARRKFYEAKDSDSTRSEYALQLFAKIYELDSQFSRKDLDSYEDRKTVREKQIKPLYEKLLAWIQEESHKILPKSPIGKAMSYFQSQYPKLIRCLDDGKFHLDNNWIENKIRPLALGRKNYLFAGSHSGAHWMAMMYSFFGTCFMNDINPRDWLKQTMEALANQKIEDFATLVPGYIKR